MTAHTEGNALDAPPEVVDLRATGAAALADVLVVGTEDWSIDSAVNQLVAGGHPVHRCSDSTETPFPCNALVPGRGCPLDGAPVRVVLGVRGRPGGGVTAGELGAVCGLRAGLPLVLAGFHAGSPLSPYADRVPDPGDLVVTVEGVTT
ncbi:MAG TPA: hypothetical protein VFP61_15555 [Acidimicrobiales bacterium]|nr:hypothetical protein [Acidimicrobiales bacterium]